MNFKDTIVRDILAGESVQDWVGGVEVSLHPDAMSLQVGFGITRFVGGPGVKTAMQLRDMLDAWIEAVS